MAGFLAINFGTLRMLDWLKRKAVPVPGEQLLESEGQKPLTDERVERLLGRLGDWAQQAAESLGLARPLPPLPTAAPDSQNRTSTARSPAEELSSEIAHVATTTL